MHTKEFKNAEISRAVNLIGQMSYHHMVSLQPVDNGMFLLTLGDRSTFVTKHGYIPDILTKEEAYERLNKK